MQKLLEQLIGKDEEQQIVMQISPQFAEQICNNQLNYIQIQQRYCSHFLPMFKEITGMDLPNTKNFILTYSKNTAKLLLLKMINSLFSFNKRCYVPPTNNPQIQIKIYSKSQYYNVVLIQITYSHFRKFYKVLNQLEKSHRHQNKLVGFGSFSNVYHCESFQENPIVVKCLKYDDSCLSVLKNHIKQFFLYDLMSTLEIGPKIIKNHSFDFIIFKDCIEFHLEKCYPINSTTLQKDIKQHLLNMHSLNFTHSDIKPSNIMYSKTYNKNVLIDFGTAQFIKEKLGLMHLSSFKGTYEFCGDQMRQIFALKQPKFIDIYYNDIQMLQKSINYIMMDEKLKKQICPSQKRNLNNKTSSTSQNIRCHQCSDITSMRIKINIAFYNPLSTFRSFKSIKIKKIKNMQLNRGLNLSILLKIKARFAQFMNESQTSQFQQI